MSLPFQKDNSVRNYVCFICGRGYADFDQFKEHIITTHEEGREYVLCPLQRCRAPVRDVKLHFKVKHPTEKEIPKNCQMKAIVWKDFSGKKSKKKKGPIFREGYMVSVKNGGKEMHYRSGLECQVYECLECLSEVIKYDVEPFEIGYFWEGTHTYTPDLSILFADGHVEIWEVKPSDQTTLPQNLAKWAAAEQHCEVRGWEFSVITEKGLANLKKKIKFG